MDIFLIFFKFQNNNCNEKFLNKNKIFIIIIFFTSKILLMTLLEYE